jgi:tRNA-dihydrouridine synthase B
MDIEHFLGAVRIGSVVVEEGAWLAPLSGVTDVAFRRIALRYGAGLVVSEMVAANELLTASEEARLRAEGSGIRPHVVQLAGRDPESMAAAGRLAQAAGADIVDINMGCPAKRVTGGLAGSALMRELDLAQRIVEAVAGAVQVPVTVKMRLGWDERQITAPELARRAVRAGACAIAVHGRTRQQFYKGSADWGAVAAVSASVPVPVTVNGDIVSASSARVALRHSGAAAVMIGRAALGRPWLVGQIAASLRGRTRPTPSWPQRADIAAEHYDVLLTLYGRSVGMRHARKHLAAYADAAAEDGGGLSTGARLQMLTTDEPAEVFGRLAELGRPRLERAA